MLDEKDLLDRVIKIKNLKEDCFKYLEESASELLTNKIILSIASLSSKKMSPVKLSEIAHDIFGVSDKSKQDLVRLTIGKSLTKCGIVEKLRYGVNDVRYMLTAYRFQKVREIDSFRKDKVEPIGSIFELPKATWPIPDEYFVLISKKFGYQQALKKINSDFDNNLIPRGQYETLVRDYTENLSQIHNKLGSKFSQLEELLT